MENLLIIASIGCAGAAIFLLFRQRERMTVRPRLVSWYVWAILHVMLAVAMYSDGHYAGAGLAGIIAIGAIVLGFVTGRQEAPKYRLIDAVVQIAAIVTVIAWIFFSSPSIAVISGIALDCLAAIPIIRYYFVTNRAKGVLLVYSLLILAGVTALFAAGNWSVTAIAFPLYVVAINLVAAAVLLTRSKHSGDDHFTSVTEV